ncbi:MAG TPA: hypothetical protein VFZ65_19345 [Planctomycetota bacterium]|nr:hypothetical protein [Planctomycetota bacterium]
MLGCLVLLVGRGGRLLALAAGAALGLSLWVKAESILALVIGGLMILVGLSLCDRAIVQRRLLLLFASACAAVALSGQLIENRGALTLEWDTDKPIVASSHQCRVDGIRDSFEVLCSMGPAQAHEILNRRRVRWWIRQGDPSFLLQYHLVVPGRAMLGRSEPGEGEPRINLSPSVKQTFWARTAAGGTLPDWLELVYESPAKGLWWGFFDGPQFRVFRVRYDDEPR